MAYHDWRTNAILSEYDEVIRNFVDGYKFSRPTVVLLPGGMGSRLRRSSHPYQRGSIAAIPDSTVWFDLDTLIGGEARTLEIQSNDRDQGGHVIVPKGPLRFPVDAYGIAERFFCHPKTNFNYVVFSYDWRRPLVECARYLRYFLKELKRRVYAKHQDDPSPQLTLLAHSQGGLIATLFLHSTHNALEMMSRLITVATPFYGTWSQHQRYYVGERALSLFYSRREMAQIISTLGGPYNLLFLPRSLFDRIRDKLELERYPLRDIKDKDSPDPFSDESGARYPSWVNRNKLNSALDTYFFIGTSLPDRVREHVYNLRSVADPKTPIELEWSELPMDFDPDDDAHGCPIRPASCGKGDGTVPAWSAYHVSVDSKNRREFKSIKDHTFILEDPHILKVIKNVVNGCSVSEDASYDRTPVQKIGLMERKKTQKILLEFADGTRTRHSDILRRENFMKGVYGEMNR